MPLAFTSPLSLALIAVTAPLGALRSRSHARLRRASTPSDDPRLSTLRRVQAAVTGSLAPTDEVAKIVRPYFDVALPACGLPLVDVTKREQLDVQFAKITHHIVSVTPRMAGVLPTDALRWSAADAIAGEVISKLETAPRQVRAIMPRKRPSRNLPKTDD